MSAPVVHIAVQYGIHLDAGERFSRGMETEWQSFFQTCYSHMIPAVIQGIL